MDPMKEATEKVEDEMIATASTAGMKTKSWSIFPMK
jgi:hypothetical protein